MGVDLSSIIYKVFNDGTAIKINIIAGKEVQNISISWDSKKNRLNLFDIIEERIRYMDIKVIATRMIIEWSWKKIKCSIKGEFLFWKDKLDQIGILVC